MLKEKGEHIQDRIENCTIHFEGSSGASSAPRLPGCCVTICVVKIRRAPHRAGRRSGILVVQHRYNFLTLSTFGANSLTLFRTSTASLPNYISGLLPNSLFPLWSSVLGVLCFMALDLLQATGASCTGLIALHNEWMESRCPMRNAEKTCLSFYYMYWSESRSDRRRHACKPPGTPISRSLSKPSRGDPNLPLTTPISAHQTFGRINPTVSYK